MTAHDHVVRTGIQARGVGPTNLNLDLWQTSCLLPGYGYRCWIGVYADCPSFDPGTFSQ
jgi:hypothetical protein